MAEKGNEYVGGDILRVLLALKENVMHDLHVADICTVISKTETEQYTTYMCKSICNSAITVEALALANLEIENDDMVLIVFCDKDIRMNYKKLKANKQIQNIDVNQRHSLSFGVIVGRL